MKVVINSDILYTSNPLQKKYGGCELGLDVSIAEAGR
jgi:hypothetical protein